MVLRKCYWLIFLRRQLCGPKFFWLFQPGAFDGFCFGQFFGLLVKPGDGQKVVCAKAWKSKVKVEISWAPKKFQDLLERNFFQVLIESGNEVFCLFSTRSSCSRAGASTSEQITLSRSDIFLLSLIKLYFNKTILDSFKGPNKLTD